MKTEARAPFQGRKRRLPDRNKTPLWNARVPRELQRRMRAAADEDGLTLAGELHRLLDIRDQFDALTLPKHPLAQAELRPAAYMHRPGHPAWSRVTRPSAAPRDTPERGVTKSA